LLDDLLEDRGVIDVDGSQMKNQGQATPIDDQMHLGGEPATRTAQSLRHLPALMITLSDRPLNGPFFSAPQQRAGERGR
jgi:hypothetical protein